MLTRRQVLRAALGTGIVLNAPLLRADSVPSVPTPQGVISLSIHPDRHRQVIENFGASDAWSFGPIGREWDVAHRNQVADLLFSQTTGIGLSVWRYNIGAGSDLTDGAAVRDPWRREPCFRRDANGPYDWSAQAGQDWFLRAARQRGVEQFLAFANSPPAWLTKNGHAYGDAQSGSTNLKSGGEAAFAQFLGDVCAHYHDIGLGFDYVSPINEPGWSWEAGNRQEGCRYNVDDTVRVLRALHGELNIRKIKTQVVGPEAVDMESLLDDAAFQAWSGTTGVFTAGNADPKNGWGSYRNYIARLLGDAEMREILQDRLLAHSYGDENHGDPKSVTMLRRAVRANLNQAAPGAKYWMSEFCILERGRDLGMDAALRVAALMHHDLVDGEASGWQWWTAVSPVNYQDGLIYTDYKQTKQQNIIPTKTLWAMGNFSRFVRPGAHRVGVDTAPLPSGLLLSAYVNAHQKTTVIVAVNSSETAYPVMLTARGKPLTLTPYVTSEAASLTAGTRFSSNTPYAIPARSVVTFVG